MFRPHINTFIDICEFGDQNKKEAYTKLTIKSGIRFLIKSPVRHLAAILAGGGGRRWPFD